MDLFLRIKLDPREICTAQQKGACIINGRIRFFTKRRVADSNRRIRAAIVEALSKSGVELDTKYEVVGGKVRKTDFVRDTIKRGRAVRLYIGYFFPYPVGTAQKLRKPLDWMTERPDVDNLTKSVQDVLTDLKMWHDDSQLASVHIEKFRTDGEPCMLIRVRTADDCCRVAKDIEAIAIGD